MFAVGLNTRRQVYAGSLKHADPPCNGPLLDDIDIPRSTVNELRPICGLPSYTLVRSTATPPYLAKGS